MLADKAVTVSPIGKLDSVFLTHEALQGCVASCQCSLTSAQHSVRVGKATSYAEVKQLWSPPGHGETAHSRAYSVGD